jgi:hypothetical protein
MRQQRRRPLNKTEIKEFSMGLINYILVDDQVKSRVEDEEEKM